MPPAAGMRFGRYELLDRLGAGGMGEVFRASDHDLRRDVAIKFLSAQFASDPDGLARFAQEARAASSLNHPNIVTIHEIGEASGLRYIVMELVEGQTLRRLVRDRPLSARRALDLGVQLAEGLAKAHAAGIVHRDLKPENVMVTKDGFVKILDFGLAKLRSDGRAAASGEDGHDGETQLPARTTGGVILGTVGYMSPEQAKGEPADHRSDQFALGAVLYELVTGRRAFHRDSAVQTMTAIIEDSPEPIAALSPDFPAPALWAVERCLEKDPENRYASTLDLARELRNVREHLAESDGSGRLKPAAVRPRARWWHLAVGAAVVVAGVLLAPRVRQEIVTRLWSPPLPSEMRIAVLPIDAAGVPEQTTTCCAGLLEYVVVRLAELDRFQARASIVPVAELRSAGVTSPSAAKRVLGATMTVSISVSLVGANLLVAVNLADAERVRQLKGDQRRFAAATFTPQDVASLVVRVLELELAAKHRAAWDEGASDVAQAGVLYAQALGQTPYQQAQGKLEQYDQVRSLEQAVALLNEAINLNPRYAAAHAALAETRLRLYRLTRKPEDVTLAQQSVKQALSLDDTRPGAWVTLGMIFAQQGNIDEAERAFGDAIARNPRGADAYRELGLAEQRAKRWDKAEAAYRKAVELQPKAWSSHNYLGSFLNVRKRFPEAETEFRTAIDLAPANARAWSNLGGVYLAQERWDEAEKALDEALRNQRYGPAYSNLAYIQYYVRGQFADAARTLEQATQAAPRDSRIWMNLAIARYRAPGQRAGAMEAYRQAAGLLEQERTIDPTDPAILVSLADCYAMLGDGARARAAAGEALKRDIAEDDWPVLVGVFEDLGDREEAIRQVRAAFKAGVAPEAFESDFLLEKLRQDPRYAAAVKGRAVK
jgi:tetratricopeptide (TPR) repeat protein